jgi:pyruvate formate lyase activating enzyme
MKKLNVSCIQRFSTGDGPGIRTTVFLKGCNLKCPWCHNPENISPEPQMLEYRNANKIVSYGKMMTVKEVVSDIMEDIEFYRAGDGGVTLSGGEPMLQYEAVSELCSELHKNGVTVIIDTAGCVPWENFVSVIDSADIFYYDYKTADDDAYKNICGGDKSLVLSNLCSLLSNKKSVHVRIPLIPGFNMSESDCENICADLLSAGAEYVDLLPFHRMGSSKYEALGLDYAYKKTTPPNAKTLTYIKNIYGKYFTVNIE